MTRRYRGSVFFVVCLLAAGCAGPQRNPELEGQMGSIRSILIVPVTNESLKVNAPDYLLSTITVPMAEHGYYVFPVYSVKRMLEDNGLADADLVHQADPQRLGELFGADAILYIKIHHWEAKYIVIKTYTTVRLTYVLADARTGEVIWEHTQQSSVQSGGSSSGNPIADLVGAAIEAALYKVLEDVNCMDLARQAHALTLMYPGHGIPPGPYSEEEEKNAGTKDEPDLDS